MEPLPHNQKNTAFAKRVLGRIADERLSPRPYWEFAFKNYFFWGVGALSVLFGALAFSALIFDIENVDWRFALVTHSNLPSFFFDVVPVVWIVSLILFMLIGYINVRRTNHGYRYPLPLIACGAVLTSLVIGMAFYTTGFGGAVEGFAGAHLPFHQSILVTEHAWWLAPEKGLLGGRIVSATPNITSFMLRDFKGALWTIDGSDLRVPDRIAVARGGIVRVVGVPIVASSSEFHACFVFPWESRGGFGDIPPPPLAVITASTSEINSSPIRSEQCRGIRPYQQLRSIDQAGF
ncbi:MAG TPA: hypothetical protein VMV38_00290 [Candidatus Paceibacterota bacterium]|nr:hypothetical protein [Candidatus Paceibacterota bacterium]